MLMNALLLEASYASCRNAESAAELRVELALTSEAVKPADTSIHGGNQMIFLQNICRSNST